MLRSTLLSFAILRTSGEERSFSPDAAAAGDSDPTRDGGAVTDGAPGVGAAGAAGAAGLAAPADPLITATTVLMVTVEPSGNLISVSTPAVGDGISASTLSVEISNSGSSRSTVSPTCLSHLVMVPSVMDSPICGMGTSVPGPALAGAAAGAAGGGASSAAGAAGAGASAGAAAAGAGAEAPAPSPITATMVLIWTVAPSAILISCSVPAAGEGISASTLSVEISNSGSSRWTESPTFLSHFVRVPSVIDSPIWGITTSVAIEVPSRVLSAVRAWVRPVIIRLACSRVPGPER